MTTKAIDKPAKSDRSTARQAASCKSTSKRASAATTIPACNRAAPSEEPIIQDGVTKLALLLQLLNRPEGASIEDMMQATAWQQHSVRGFLAGTVKKKMGLPLTSSKAEGEVRRYRVVTRRGR